MSTFSKHRGFGACPIDRLHRACALMFFKKMVNHNRHVNSVGRSENCVPLKEIRTDFKKAAENNSIAR